MIPFKAPLDDILFSLRTMADTETLPDWDEEMAEPVLQAFADFAEGVIAPLNGSGDAQGCRLEDGRVHMPDGFCEAYAQLAEGGWQGVTAPEEHGGMALGPLIAAGISEVFSGANHALQMVCNLTPGAVATLLKFGTPEQQRQWLPALVSGEVLPTMCLTEPGAGSDLSRIRTKAKKSGEAWLIEGEKIFISGGDQNMSEGILHLVLARGEGAPEGIKGLSLFLCPAQLQGADNGITITRIEEKMGLHASPTCQMAFDGAKAELIGQEGAGLMAMFSMMNHARLDVALQGVGHAARAHHIAATYAAERTQGRTAEGAPAKLSDHLDVQRMLREQQRLAVCARAMVHATLGVMARGDQPELVDFLTPVVKKYGSEAGIKSADLGIQILGGYGYLEEYGVSQIWRDARITAIYEGANGIQAMTTATRGLKGAGADQFRAWVSGMGGADQAFAELLSRWDDLRAQTLSTAGPSLSGLEFAEVTGQLFARACLIKLVSAATEDAEQSELANLL